MKLGIQEKMIPGTSLGEKFDSLEHLSLQAIELIGDNLWDRLPAIKKELSQHPKIAVSTICTGYRGKLLSLEANERKLAMADIDQLLRIGGELGCRGLILVPRLFDKRMVPNLEPYATAETLEARLFESVLEEIVKKSTSNHCPIILEPLNRYLNDCMNTGSAALGFAKKFKVSQVGVMLDFFHMNIEESSFARAIGEVGERLLHVHLADSNRLWPGEGQIDWTMASSYLKSSGYDGYAVLECMVGVPTMDRLSQSIRLLRESGF